MEYTQFSNLVRRAALAVAVNQGHVEVASKEVLSDEALERAAAWDAEKELLARYPARLVVEEDLVADTYESDLSGRGYWTKKLQRTEKPGEFERLLAEATEANRQWLLEVRARKIADLQRKQLEVVTSDGLMLTAHTSSEEFLAQVLKSLPLERILDVNLEQFQAIKGGKLFQPFVAHFEKIFHDLVAAISDARNEHDERSVSHVQLNLTVDLCKIAKMWLYPESKAKVFKRLRQEALADFKIVENEMEPATFQGLAGLTALLSKQKRA